MTATIPPVEANAEACAATPANKALPHETATPLAALLKAAADPLRLRILSLITASTPPEACVCDFLELDDVSQPTVSHHLKVLRDAGLVTSQRRGTWVYYRIAPQFLAPVTGLLEGFSHVLLDHAPDPHADGLANVESALDRMTERLAVAHPQVSGDLVAHIVRESYAGLARKASIKAHLVPLSEHFARQRLQDVSRDKTATTTPQVLFVCTQNAGRSQLAAALTRLHGGDRIVVRSAGSAPASQIHPHVRDELATIDAPFEDAFPKPLTDDAVRAADVVITMGCGDVCPIIPGVSYEDWPVGDPALASREGVAAIRADIDARVTELLQRLGVTP
ncbi:metalloregulator ArsR/SmtB family transcription factor [Jonesia quinghaiensis]|uniref:metalloregulator ArsR/SmtB family transcription factor n=1 Tax=Jonesia quinghaiensis TaxID=262806 RepID=UPI0004043E24|nr:metalloregulator ArsR/SmtB family transcription factor [Jonesia quinghaiensis]